MTRSGNSITKNKDGISTTKTFDAGGNLLDNLNWRKDNTRNIQELFQYDNLNNEPDLFGGRGYVGVWFGGVGAVPGAIIGGVVGGVLGSWRDSALGGATVWAY